MKEMTASEMLRDACDGKNPHTRFGTRNCAQAQTHDLIPSDTPWPTAMLISIHKLTSRSYPSMVPTYRVALLEGWEQSEGARLEKAVAEACGIPVKTVDEWMEEAR